MRELAQLLLPAVRWDPAAGFAPALPAVVRGIAAGVGGFVIEGGTRDAVAELTDTIRKSAGDAPDHGDLAGGSHVIRLACAPTLRAARRGDRFPARCAGCPPRGTGGRARGAPRRLQRDPCAVV